jgi:tRNA1(Val) A37 N6-methylase TrmN6
MEKTNYDKIFDEVRPELVSYGKWSGADTIVKAATFFKGCKNVLDIGSGIGKFVIIAAMVNPDTLFTGIEVNPETYKSAMEYKEHFNLDNTEFILGDFCDLDKKRFDGYYIFNPFFMSPAFHNEIKSQNTFKKLIEDMPAGNKLAVLNRCFHIDKEFAWVHPGEEIRGGCELYIKS